jgi:protein-S-isoprenylcysteine O-methyltransferase Ste14
LGGHKSNKIIDYGPFSMVRNPLYLFSFIAALGLSVMSNNILILIMVPSVYLLIYLPLIKREEGYLSSYFGKPYDDYCEKTPRIIPSFKNYKNQEFITCSSASLISAFKDSIWWFIGAMFFVMLK